MRNPAEDRVRNFYSTVGWEEQSGITEDSRRFEDLRDSAREYVSKSRLRVLRHIPAAGEKMLDMASGPVQYPEYVEYSRTFAKRYCVDLSMQALESAKKKIGDRGVFLCGSFMDLDLNSDIFDCVISLHTIYHIDRDLQEQAVRKLLRVCKPGAPIVIVYSNPDHLRNKLGQWARFARLITKPKAVDNAHVAGELYFFAHPLSWWNRFRDEVEVKIYPCRFLSSDQQKRLIPDNGLGRTMFSILYAAEEAFPQLFAKYSMHPMIVMTKR
jgi:ubiquinone/menaquinone biosynthesis C-methylase UbiE